MMHLMSSVMIMISILMNIMILTMGESKMMGSVQSSIGPSIVGYFGLGQGLADGMKLYMKTGMESSNEYFSSELMMMMMMLSLSCWFIFPLCYGSIMVISEWSLWYMLMMSGIGIFGILVGGNMGESMYGKMGGVRGIMQIMSNEIYMGMVWMMIMLMCGSMNLCSFNAYQMGHKNIEMLWLMFMIMMINMLGELQSAPLDMTEGESELMSGYNMEFGGFLFAGYFMAEYSNMMLEAYMMALMLGGGLKTALFVMWIIMWISCIFPRISMDKVIKIGWTKMLPMMMGYYLMVLLTIKLMDGFS